MDANFKEILISLLKTDERLLDAEGELMGNKLQHLVDKTDEKIIELLISNDNTRDKFFIKIKDVYVFKTSDFKFYIDETGLCRLEYLDQPKSVEKDIEYWKMVKTWVKKYYQESF